ncbi:hypothetical protein CAFE_30850 [Caprobacter fermentans]|uniref:Uncharacterized protein n=1 Tax=Caproicibacter fermentans TaxID=2576756 RepID=A0A6N8I2J1_9FIRM|nr:hypothetical protein [Caproicibacter fermentans]MVB12351.1 hypothetical protein [Caproicibacter fermentans]
MNSNEKKAELNTISSAAQQIDIGVTHLELTYDLLQILFDAAESEFLPAHPGSATEEIVLKRLSMYDSAVSILQDAMKDALTELQGGRNSLYNGIRKGGAAV